jgi:hypothetical protein
MKQSQQAANYRQGAPRGNCGVCRNFDSKAHTCDVVEGKISAYGFSDRYLQEPNPFRTDRPPVRIVSNAGGNSEAIRPAPAEMRVRIGNRTY